MTDLHKPLGPDRKPKSARKIPGWLYTLVGLGLVSLAGYGIYAAQKSTTTVVSLNDAEAPATAPTAPAKPEPAEDEPVVEDPQPAPQTSVVKPEAPEAPVFKPKRVTSNKRTPGIPDLNLVEKSEFGPLPKISDTGLRPLDAYAVPTSTVGSVRIAIVMGGLGVSQTGTKQAIKQLPSTVTLAYSPIGNSLQRWMQTARKAGHEVTLQIPMEPLGYPSIDPGRGTLITADSKGQNMKSLRWALGRMSNYPVVMNYLGANFTNNEQALRPILQEIKDRGLGWLDDGSAQASKSLDIAEQIRLPHVSGNFVLDAQNQPSKISERLKLLELYARRRGYAVGTATAFPKTVTQVTKWIAEAEKRGIQIVPLSNLLRDYGR